MSFFDELKEKAGALASQAAGAAAKVVATKKVSIVLERIPTSLEEMQSMPQASLKDPAEVAALTVAALCMYPVDREISIQMLNFLKGPQPLTPYEIQFLADRFMDKDYVPRSFFKGAVPGNNYDPSLPYTLEIAETPYSRMQSGYISLFLTSGGADSPRQIKLRNKPSTGQWFLWEQMLLADIRIPTEKDPWA